MTPHTTQHKQRRRPKGCQARAPPQPCMVSLNMATMVQHPKPCRHPSTEFRKVPQGTMRALGGSVQTALERRRIDLSIPNDHRRDEQENKQRHAYGTAGMAGYNSNSARYGRGTRGRHTEDLEVGRMGGDKKLVAHNAGPEYAWQTARAMCEASPICCELIGIPSTVTQGTQVCRGCSDSVAARAYRAADESRPCAVHSSTLPRGRPARDAATVARTAAAAACGAVGVPRVLLWEPSVGQS